MKRMIAGRKTSTAERDGDKRKLWPGGISPPHGRLKLS